MEWEKNRRKKKGMKAGERGRKKLEEDKNKEGKKDRNVEEGKMKRRKEKE